MAIALALDTDRYAGESEARQELAEAMVENGWRLEDYGLSDDEEKRRVTFTIGSMAGGDHRPLVVKAVEVALQQFGYDLDSIKIKGCATKPLSDPNQSALPLD